MQKITSLQNPKIKFIQRLSKAGRRKDNNLFIVEGLRELTLAIESGYKIHSLYWCAAAGQTTALHRLIDKAGQGVEIYEINKEAFDKLAYRENRDGIIGLAIPTPLPLEGLRLGELPFLIVIESVEKPGNLGAILRTADAAKVDAVIVCDPRTDIYNPNVVRSSIGCLFTCQVAVCSSDEAIRFFKEKRITLYAAALTAEKYYHQVDFTLPAAIAMGTEAHGLSDKWLSSCDAQIKIPMRGKIDSLNVSTSTAILTFEAMRQRGF